MNQIGEIKRMIENPLFYNDKPYLVTTQNENYISKILPENSKKACTILGAGDPVFELASNGIEDITAVDTNPFQTFVYHLRKASLLTLEPKEFEGFLLDSNRKIFLSPEVFKVVKEGFTIEEEKSREICEYLFSTYDRKALEDNLFKNAGGSINLLRQSLPYVKNKTAFYNLKDRLEKIKISLINGDVLTYLSSHPEEIFDYIDITNVLLFIYQIDCKENQELLREKIAQLTTIYEQNLSSNGVFVLDYFFGNGIKSLLEPKKETVIKSRKMTMDSMLRDMLKTYEEHSIQKIREIYKVIYLELQKLFELETVRMNHQISTFGTENDTVVYTKKKYYR